MTDQDLSCVNNTNAIIIRKANVNDAQDMKNINEQSLEENYPLEEWQTILQDPQHASYVACTEKGIIVGYMLTIVTFDFLSYKREAHIASFAVLSSYRRKGVGTKLMQTTLETLERERKAPTCQLNVRIDNLNALRLYEQHGFTISGIKKNYYRDSTDAYIMRRPLK